jgi:hypothetical protein
MPDPALPDHVRKPLKGFNVQRWIISATIALLLCFLGAWLILAYSGRHLLPQKQHHYHPHAALRMPDQGRRAA